MNAQHWELPFSTAAPAIARRRVAEVLSTANADQRVIDDALLLVSEVVSNAVVHGQGPVSLEVARLPAGWRLSVQDCSPAAPEMRSPSVDREGGRGLSLVMAIASSWGTQPQVEGGKKVWFTV